MKDRVEISHLTKFDAFTVNRDEVIDLEIWFKIHTNVSLRSKRFRRVWEQRKTEERGFRYFACAENGARAKNRTVGVGEGKEGTACGQTPGF